MNTVRRPGASATIRFERRRSDILDVASAHINTFGVRGMTLTAVAQALGIDTSSITYYFRKKEDLATACLMRSLDWQREAAKAAAEHDPRSAVRMFLRAHLEVYKSDRPSDGPHLALLGDMRSASGKNRDRLFASYSDGFRMLRRCFEKQSGDRSQSLIAASVLMATVHWLSAWIVDYGDYDFSRIEQRLADLLDRGLGTGADWSFDGTLSEEPSENEAQMRFLHAATNLINRDGYHGASVEKIAAELGVSTGSFYHHLDNKDELVVACFKRSHALLARALAIGEAGGGGHAKRLARTASSIVRLQFEGTTPLLRTSAYSALPPELRLCMLRHHDQMTRHIAGAIADGIAAGAIRPVDPLLASYFFVSVMNAAPWLRNWAQDRPLDDAVTRYASVLQRGIFCA